MAHRATFYLDGGQTITVKVESLETYRHENGGFAGYKIDWPEGEEASFFFIDPNKVIGVVAFPMEE